MPWHFKEGENLIKLGKEERTVGHTGVRISPVPDDPEAISVFVDERSLVSVVGVHPSHSYTKYCPVNESTVIRGLDIYVLGPDGIPQGAVIFSRKSIK